MISNQNREWLNDFEQFVGNNGANVPPTLNDRVWNHLKPLVEPSGISVFLKLIILHFIVGLLSFSVCHQFGINPFGTTDPLGNVFERVGGHSFCLIACGVFFIGLTYLASGIIFTIEEVKTIKSTEFLQTISLSLISLFLFHFLGAELALGFAGLWLLGAIIGGFVATETLWYLKRAH